MTKVVCILVVDIASLSLFAQCYCCCAPEPPPRRQLFSRLLPALLNIHIEQIHHCMLFSLQHLQFVIQWSSSLLQLHRAQSYILADQTSARRFQRHRRTSPQQYVTLLLFHRNDTVQTPTIKISLLFHWNDCAQKVISSWPQTQSRTQIDRTNML